MRLRERKKDKTRADLLAAALRLSDSQGYTETTINRKRTIDPLDFRFRRTEDRIPLRCAKSVAF